MAYGSCVRRCGGESAGCDLASFVATYLSVRFLKRYFRTRTPYPIAVSGPVVGAGALVWLSTR